MLFNSATFALFFPVVFAAYVSLNGRTRAQNALLLLASYVFYGWWDWRFLSLIWVSTAVDYVLARRIAATESQRSRRALLLASLAVNLGLLGTFKYLGFFIDSAVALLRTFGLDSGAPTLALVLPVGISFYTFQTLSYTIDVYRGKLEPTRDALEFALFVAFFPQLVAGPIERASNLLPQVAKARRITAARIDLGCYLLVQGFFKKLVIADNCALIANRIFDDYARYDGVALVTGVLAFSFQIYGDFSGYSDIARGLAAILGFDLMVNFRLPYLSLSPSEFWRRWHISLSTWLRDYLYIPLGGNRLGSARTYWNLLATMALGGLWHGAAWNFVLWGVFHGAILMAYRAVPGVESALRASRPRTVFAWVVMFGLTQFGWLLFRAESLDQIGYFLVNGSLWPRAGGGLLSLALVIWPLVVLDLWQWRRGNLLAGLALPPLRRGLLYAVQVGAIMLFGVRESIEFVYFQF